MKRTTKRELAARLTSDPAKQAIYVKSYTLTMLWHTLGDTLMTPAQYRMSMERLDAKRRESAKALPRVRDRDGYSWVRITDVKWMCVLRDENLESPDAIAAKYGPLTEIAL